MDALLRHIMKLCGLHNVTYTISITSLYRFEIEVCLKVILLLFFTVAVRSPETQAKNNNLSASTFRFQSFILGLSVRMMTIKEIRP